MGLKPIPIGQGVVASLAGSPLPTSRPRAPSRPTDPVSCQINLTEEAPAKGRFAFWLTLTFQDFDPKN